MDRCQHRRADPHTRRSWSPEVDVAQRMLKPGRSSARLRASCETTHDPRLQANLGRLTRKPCPPARQRTSRASFDTHLTLSMSMTGHERRPLRPTDVEPTTPQSRCIPTLFSQFVLRRNNFSRKSSVGVDAKTRYVGEHYLDTVGVGSSILPSPTIGAGQRVFHTSGLRLFSALFGCRPGVNPAQLTSN